jgi:hypothetical protein
MKLRIKGNSLRLRLLRSEVESLAATGRVSEEIILGTAVLTYTMSVSAGEKVAVHFAANEIVVSLPETVARNWMQTDEVSIEAEQPAGPNGNVLSILIEKDFECIGRPDDPDRADAYPNPELTCEGEATSG